MCYRIDADQNVYFRIADRETCVFALQVDGACGRSDSKTLVYALVLTAKHVFWHCCQHNARFRASAGSNTYIFALRVVGACGHADGKAFFFFVY